MSIGIACDVITMHPCSIGLYSSNGKDVFVINKAHSMLTLRGKLNLNNYSSIAEHCRAYRTYKGQTSYMRFAVNSP